MAGDDGSMAVVVIVVGGSEAAVGRLVVARADLGLVDSLARLQLAARRLGCSVRLRYSSTELLDLLDLVGLADVVGATGLTLEPRREAEGGEQLGVEIVVDSGDPSV